MTLASLLIQSAQAATPQANPEIQIPQEPSAPPSMVQTVPPDPFRCHRRFIYQGRTLDCDTNVQRDGEKLRPIIKDVPEAVSELDAYQRNRRTLRNSAYAASAGLLIALIGYLSSRGPGGFSPADDQGVHHFTPAAYLVFGGVAIGAGSFIYGFTAYKSNESHLNNAVSNFNKARPDTPIELEFTTGIKF